ncbi:MAG TPA: helix-turn-helix domain-containing protein [Methylomirabilota bacterium]|jgi:DNA-binding GntR family transcriptional regulator
MDHWWSEIDHAILRCLHEAGGALAPAEIGRRLGMSEESARSALVMLAHEGKIRISRVELGAREVERAHGEPWHVTWKNS